MGKVLLCGDCGYSGGQEEEVHALRAGCQAAKVGEWRVISFRLGWNTVFWLADDRSIFAFA